MLFIFVNVFMFLFFQTATATCINNETDALSMLLTEMLHSQSISTLFYNTTSDVVAQIKDLSLACRTGLQCPPICSLEGHTPTCKCQLGYTGSLCSTKKTCPYGYKGWPWCNQRMTIPGSEVCDYSLAPDLVNWDLVRCRCKQGFHGTPHVCLPIPLPRNAEPGTCTFTQKSNGNWRLETCECKRGFKGAPFCSHKVLQPDYALCSYKKIDAFNWDIDHSSCVCQGKRYNPPACLDCSCIHGECVENFCRCETNWRGDLCEQQVL